MTVSFQDNGDPRGPDHWPGTGVDPLSIPAPITFAADGPHTATATVKDLAGNESAPGSLVVQVDAAAPVVSASFKKADGSAYVPGTWTDQAVTTTFACTDAGGAGVASVSPPATVSTPGSHAVTGTCTDNVGHTTSRRSPGSSSTRPPPEAKLAFRPGDPGAARARPRRRFGVAQR